MIITKLEFISKMNNACNEADEKNIIYNQAVTFAQAALESNWGNSELAQKANNLFAIKAGTSWKGEVVFLKGWEWNEHCSWFSRMEFWRKYGSWTDCILDYANIIAGHSWFQDALPYIHDPSQFLKRLLPDGKNPGWATDPNYFQKVVQIGKQLANYGGPKWNLD
ncbi:MAG TPA: hypothetical protein DDW65_03690 [Firmicutes bacterium]|nr:hypothetical protein [Bacillota bacterium]